MSMHCMRGWLLAALLILSASALAAPLETPRLRLIGVEQGLPSSNVNGLAFDRAGYLWVATTDGLARYDGVGMRVWQHVADDPASLPGNFVEAVHIDEHDRVWAAVEGRGLGVLDAARTAFRRYNRASYPQIGSDDVWAIASRRSELWFGTFGGGLHRLDARGGITRFMPEADDPRSLPSDTVLALAVDAGDRLWVATPAGLARWTGRDFERVALPGAVDASVHSLTVDAGGLWVGAADGLYRLDPDGRWHAPAWSPMFGKPNAVTALASDGDGRYWIASQRGFWRVGGPGVPHPVPLATQGPQRSVFQILRQRDGAIWLPVSGAGIGYLPPGWQRLSQPVPPDAAEGRFYRYVAASASGGVWLAWGRGGVDKLGRDGAFETLPAAFGTRLRDRRVLAVAEDRKGRLWLGERAALLRIEPDGRSREWTVASADDAPLGGQIDLLRVAPDGTLWMSCAGAGLQQRDADSGRVLEQVLPGPAQGLGVGDLEAMGFDGDGVLWVAGADGVRRWDATSKVLRPVPGVVDGDRVFAFGFDGADTLWLHRLTGLERYRLTRTGWREEGRVGAAQGMPAVEAAGLEIDAGGRVWVSSQRGLFRWDPHARRLQRFGVEDGLSSQEFNDRAFVLGADGLLTATLADGRVAQVDTRAPDPVATAPALQLDRVETRRNGAWHALADGPITLTARDRELRVQLRLLSFANPRANRYWTRLAGHDVGWVEHTGSDAGERVFAGLAPGRYTLHARAVDASGQAAAIAPREFTVQPPWWATPAAMAAFAGALLLAFASLAFALRSRRLRREAWQRAERERELAHEASLAKSRFLATLGHEVRTPMTGVLGMSELLLDTPLTAQQRGYTDAIRGAGEHLLRLVNDALDLARVEAGKLELDDAPFDLHALLREVAQLMAPLAERRGLRFELQLGEGLPARVRGDASRVRQILLNLVGNAVKFTAEGHVALAAHAAGSGVRLSVADTGPGIGEEHRRRLFQRFEQGEGARTTTRFGGSGLGLAICQELAAGMGGTIEVESAPGRGTRFMVTLPLPPAISVADAAPYAGERGAAGQPTPAGSSCSPTRAIASQPVPAPREMARPKDLLLVEDDATVADVVAGLLRAQGHAVTHVGHGLAALAAIATNRFDLAFMDLDLPGMDGCALAGHLRGLGFELPLVAVTARVGGDAEAEALAAGFDGFMRKPVTGVALAEALRSHVREGVPTAPIEP